jgi:predicted hotdog family 3-hydroxylacyl-ACP dehydratase
MRLEIPSSGLLFEGHFPGRPILPAVALLDRALQVMVAPGSSPGLRGLANLRLRRPVLPGDVLDLQARPPAPDGRARFEVRRADEVVADGVVILGEPASPIAAGPSGLDWRPAAGSPHPADLLPHRPPMRMVEAIEGKADGGLACTARVPRGCAFDSGGTAPALVALEMAAQTAAAFEALRRLKDSAQANARIGYLVGARDVRFGITRVPVGEGLRAAVRLSGLALPLSTYSFEVAREQEVVASGTLSTWITATDA